MTINNKIRFFGIAFFALAFCNSLWAQCWTKVDAGSAHNMVVLPNGTLWTWGANYDGELGDGTYTFRYTPIQVGTDTDWSKVACGERHTLAIKTNGTLWAWGGNASGQLGDGTTVTKTLPVQIGTATNWKEISAGFYHSLAIKTDGSLWAWGLNDYGQLGLNNYTNKTVPTRVGLGVNWLSITTGLTSSAAIKTDGSLWAWGANNNGQVGDGTAITRSSPVQIGAGNTWQSVSLGDIHMLALNSNGTVWGCGNNHYGQVGLGSSGNAIGLLTQIGTDTNWTYISGGYGFSKAIKADGSLWAWGYNYMRVFGVTNMDTSYVPFQIGTDSWQSVTTGNSHSLQVKNDGTLWGCGANTMLCNGVTDGYNSTLTNINCPMNLSLEDYSSQQFTVYPNPVQDRIFVASNTVQNYEELKIMDMTGKELINTNTIENIDLEKLSPGVYLLRLYFEGKSENHKFIKQ